MRKIIIYCSLIVGILVMFVIFFTSKTYIQLAIAILLYPLLAFFVFKVFQGKIRVRSKKPTITVQLPVKSAEKMEAVIAKSKKENVAIADIDKRAFLKLIGGAGISAILFSIINKKIGGLFSGGTGEVPETISLKDTSGNKIDPVEKTPTDGYRITEIDDFSLTTYFGFTNKDSSWYIMKEDTDTGTFRYIRGASNFPDNWNNREHLGYDYFNNVFKA